MDLCFCQVKIGLRVLTRPVPDQLPTVYRTLGENYNERVLPSIIHETLKSVVAQYNASQLITQREVSIYVDSSPSFVQCSTCNWITCVNTSIFTSLLDYLSLGIK